MRLRALALIMIGSSLSSCRPGVVTEERILSPDGRYAASLKVKDYGAGISPSATVTLNDLKGRIGDDIKVFDGIGGWPIEVHWTSPVQMAITFCRGSRYTVRNSIAESSADDRDGIWEEISVTVVTSKNEIVGGKAYCQFPDPDPADAKRAFYND